VRSPRHWTRMLILWESKELERNRSLSWLNLSTQRSLMTLVWRSQPV
jgi:hypothetical protein